MSILGKLVGGTLGFVVGGPIGAMVGATAGHYLADKKSGGDQPPAAGSRLDSSEQRQAALMFSIIILAAKLCKVDGQVTRDEISAFRRVFNIPDSAMAAAGELFNRAKQDASGHEIYARQAFALFGHDREMCKSVIGALVAIACADGTFHPAERQFIADVAGILGLNRVELRQVESMFSTIDRSPEYQDDPYAVLGVAPDASHSRIKAMHRKILMENHPDLAMARGLPEEMQKIGNRKLAMANAAYDEIKRQRGVQ